MCYHRESRNGPWLFGLGAIVRPNLYIVRTKAGIAFHVEASSRQEAERRARSPRVAQEIARLILAEVARIEVVELYRGPAFKASGRLVFRDGFFT